MDWHFTEVDDDSRTVTDPVQLTVQSHGDLTQLQIFIREILQNSLDNRAENSPVRLDFRIRYLKEQEEKNKLLKVLKFEPIEKHIKSVRENEIHENRQPTFLDPKSILEKDEPLKLLYIEDYGTRGLVGAEHSKEKDRFEKPHCFLGLCRNIGDSQKGDETHGGTYGLGKTVLWKNSRLKLVMFYSRLRYPYTKEGDPQEHLTRFFGQIRLPGHVLGDQSYKGEGFFGVRTEKLTWSIFDSDADKLASDLGMRTRASDEYGTSILIVDFDDPDIDDDVEDDQETATRIKEASELFYWPAIVDGKLEVRSRTEVWNEEKWLVANPSDSSELLPFIKAYNAATSNEPQKDIELKIHSTKVPKGPREGDKAASGVFAVSIYLKESEDDNSQHHYLNKTALIRGAGMVVGYKSFPRSGLGGKDYHAVAVAGNACPNLDQDSQKAQERCEHLIGWSEPVTHDTWIPNSDRLKTWYGSRAAIRKVLENIKKSISDVTTEQTKPEGSAAPLLASLFPLDHGTETEYERNIRIEFTKAPYPLNEGQNDNLHYGFEIKVRVPARNSFSGNDKPTKWQISCQYGFYGEGRRRKIIEHALLKFTQVKRNDSAWENIENDFSNKASFEEFVHNQESIIEIRGITDKLDPFLSQMTKHEIEAKISTIVDKGVAI